jgi:hypothetical protein
MGVDTFAFQSHVVNFVIIFTNSDCIIVILQYVIVPGRLDLWSVNGHFAMLVVVPMDRRMRMLCFGSLTFSFLYHRVPLGNIAFRLPFDIVDQLGRAAERAPHFRIFYIVHHFIMAVGHPIT